MALSQEKKDKIKLLAKSGNFTAFDLSKELEVSTSSIRYYCRKWEINLPRENSSPNKILKEALRSFPGLNIKYEYPIGNRKRLDAFIVDFNLGIEFDGEYHYQPIHGEEALIERIKKDLEKERLCARKGIRLIRITEINKIWDTIKKAMLDTKEEENG